MVFVIVDIVCLARTGSFNGPVRNSNIVDEPSFPARGEMVTQEKVRGREGGGREREGREGREGGREGGRKSTRLNSSHVRTSRMPSSA